MKNLRVAIIDLTLSDQILDLILQLNPDRERKDFAALIEEIFSLPHYKCFGLFKNDQLVGLSGLWILTRFYSGKQAEIDNFVIDKAYRSLGYGKILFEEIEKYTRNINCKSVELNAYIINERAQHFYEDLGFKKLGYHFVKKL